MSNNGLVAGFTKSKQRRLRDPHKRDAKLETSIAPVRFPGRSTIPRLHSILLWHATGALVIPLAPLALL